MHTTTAQNKAHRNDVAWVASNGRSFAAADGERYTREYRNPFTGQTIRKSWRMTGRDWHIFDADGVRVGTAHSLTAAKYDAANRPQE